MPAKPHTLRWIPESVSNLMHNNGIRDRQELAAATGLSRATIYRAFNNDWSGTATGTVLAEIAGQFRVPLAHLVVEPGLTRLRTQTTTRKDIA